MNCEYLLGEASFLTDKRPFYNTALGDKGINHVRQLFDTTGAMKPWFESNKEFSLSKICHFYWIKSNNAIPKAWERHKGDDNFHDLIFSRHHIKKYQIYNLSKCNSKELYSPQVSLNDSKTTPQIYFEKLLQNKEIKWKCIYLMPRRLTIGLKVMKLRNTHCVRSVRIFPHSG